MEADTQQQPQPMTAEPRQQHEWLRMLDDDGQWQELMRSRYRRV